MKQKPYGLRVWNVVPCDGGFGEYECNGATFVRKDSVVKYPQIDGLIKNQTGPAIKGETHDGNPVVGMLVG